MILQGHKKTALKKIVRYFVETTGKQYNDFILAVDRSKGQQESNLPYDDWLAKKSMELLAELEITYKDLLENKDTINAAINADSSRNEGEFFTPTHRAEDGREYLKRMMGDLWGKAYVWDASCYTMDTELFTNRGWLNYDDLKPEDLIYSFNPETGLGEFVGYTNPFKKPVNEDLIHFGGKVIDLMVTKDHSMLVKNRDRNGKKATWEFRTAQEVFDHLNASPSGGNQLRVPSGAFNTAIHEGSNTLDPKKEAFWKFIGFYIGDGFVLTTENGCKQLRFKLGKERKQFYLEGLYEKLGVEFSVYDGTQNGEGDLYYTSNKELIDFILTNVGTGFDSKRIPYSELDVCYYPSLWDGLLNSDGQPMDLVDEDKDSVKYYTSSLNLSVDVSQLLTTLGYTVTTLKRNRGYIKVDGEVAKTTYEIYGSSRVQHSLNIHHTSLVPYEGYVWDLTLDKNHVFLVRRNGKPSFSGNCGTGNLMREAGYPTDKLFLSSLLPEDIELINATPEYEGATAFQLDFLNNIDIDENNLHFSENLPPKLREVLETDQPLVIYMNPPYKVISSKTTDVGAYMGSKGMAKCGVDIFHQFMYRLVMLKRTYNLTNVHLGIFGPITMFHSKMIEPLFEDFKTEYTFNSGMCFDAGDFANTSETIGWIIGFTAWSSKKPHEQDKPILLDARDLDENGVLQTVGSRLVTKVAVNLHTWVEPADVVRLDDELPTVSTYSTFTGLTNKVPSHAMGYLMSSNFVLRATRRGCSTTLPSNDGIPITQENFWRCVASIGARRTYVINQNPYDNCQYYSAPNTEVEGYQQWLNDALLIFLYDYDAQHASYRNLDFKGQPLNHGNAFFPIPKDVARTVITDPTILADLESDPTDNTFILNVLAETAPHFSPEARELYEFILQALLESLSDDRRKNVGYQNWTNAWNAGFIQLRGVPGLLTQEQHDKFAYLLGKLKAKLYDGIYKYGFMMDTAYEVEDDSDNEVDELEELDQLANNTNQTHQEAH